MSQTRSLFLTIGASELVQRLAAGKVTGAGSTEMLEIKKRTEGILERSGAHVVALGSRRSVEGDWKEAAIHWAHEIAS